MAGASAFCRDLGDLSCCITLAAESEFMNLTEFLIMVCKYRKN